MGNFTTVGDQTELFVGCDPDQRDRASNLIHVGSRLSAESIADTVIEVGFDKASLTVVADKLSVRHGALYRYIGDRDGMMRIAIERLTASYPWPDLDRPWPETLWNEGRAWWALCEAYPGFVDVLASVRGIAPSMARRSLDTATHLASQGIDPATALVAIDITIGLVHNAFQWSANREVILDDAKNWMTNHTSEIEAFAPPHMLQALADVLNTDNWAWYAAKLQILIDGLGKPT